MAHNLIESFMDTNNIIKYVSAIISSLKKNTKGMIKKTIHQEVSTIAFKVLLGLLISSAIVFSVIQFGLAYLQLLSLYKNELNFQLISFGFVILVGLLALYYLFKVPKPEVKQEETSLFTNFDPPNLIINFATGIMEGYNANNKKNVEHNQSHNSI